MRSQKPDFITVIVRCARLNGGFATAVYWVVLELLAQPGPFDGRLDGCNNGNPPDLARDASTTRAYLGSHQRMGDAGAAAAGWKAAVVQDHAGRRGEAAQWPLAGSLPDRA